jgi:hypothetical protein
VGNHPGRRRRSGRVTETKERWSSRLRSDPRPSPEQLLCVALNSAKAQVFVDAQQGPRRGYRRPKGSFRLWLLESACLTPSSVSVGGSHSGCGA